MCFRHFLQLLSYSAGSAHDLVELFWVWADQIHYLRAAWASSWSLRQFVERWFELFTWWVVLNQTLDSVLQQSCTKLKGLSSDSPDKYLIWFVCISTDRSAVCSTVPQELQPSVRFQRRHVPKRVLQAAGLLQTAETHLQEPRRALLHRWVQEVDRARWRLETRIIY